MKIQGKRIKVNLLLQILIAIGLGIGCGFFFPVWLGRCFATFNAIFSQLLGFIIPLLIVGFVTPAIGEVGKNAGKMLAATALVAYAFTVCSGMFAYTVGNAWFPSLISPDNAKALAEGGSGLKEYFTVEMPPLMDVTSALVLSFIFGLCIAMMPDGKFLKGFFGEMRNVISMTIGKVIIPLLPLYIFGIFLNMTVTGQVASVMGTFIKIIAIIFGMSVVLLIAQFTIAGLCVRRNPFPLLWKMVPAYFTALGTQSSAATIPVTLKQVIKMGVPEEIAGFTVPLCATIHLSGSALKITACAVALMIMENVPYTTGGVMGFICMLGVTMVAAPGVPGGAIMAALGILGSMLNFTQQDLALMIALYIAMDSFGTACNVTGDGAVSLIIYAIFGKNVSKENPIPEEARM